MNKKVFTIPKESKVIVGLCLVLLTFVTYKVGLHPQANIWSTILAFFVGTFLADLNTGIFHFGFDYVWPDRFPVMGPISVEFRAHHDLPALDPSAWISNLTRGAYMGMTFGLFAWWTASYTEAGVWQYFWAATLQVIALWGVLFHQVHSYTHMGKEVPAEEFNKAVENICQLPRNEQPPEFAKLFDQVGIPKFVRFLQRNHLFLKPEIHWRHHINFESDFSSLNGWSDPFTNPLFGVIARKRKAQKEKKVQESLGIGMVKFN